MDNRFKIETSKAEHIEFDDGMPGFGLRVRVGDKRQHRAFIAQYKIGAKHRRITLGNAAKVTLDDARVGRGGYSGGSKTRVEIDKAAKLKEP